MSISSGLSLHCHNRYDIHRKGARSPSITEVYLQDHGYNEQLISYCDNVGLSSLRKLQLFPHTLKYLAYANWLLLDRTSVYFTYG